MKALACTFLPRPSWKVHPSCRPWMHGQVCTTLGMLTPEQARQLREAGLSAYNHNLDTSPEYYGKITTSRKYEVCELPCHAASALPWCLMHGLRL